MLREILFWLAVVLPVIFVVNAFIARKQSQRVSHIQGIAGSVILIIWLGSVAAYFSGVGKPEVIAVEESAWSKTAVDASIQRIEKWESDGLLKLQLHDRRAYFSPVLWNMVDVEEKKELMMSVIIYADSQASRKHASFDFFNLNTGKQFASWGNISDFDFNY